MAGSLTSLSSFIPLTDINPENLINQHLTGLEDLFVDRNGTPWPDEWWWWRLSKGLERVEEGADVTVVPKNIVEFQDYRAGDYQQFAFFHLFKGPVFSISKIAAVYPSTGNPVDTSANPEDRDNIVTFPLNWVRLYPSGEVHLVPVFGNLSQMLIGQGNTYLPLLHGRYDYFPQLFRIEYTAGFQTEQIPFIIADAIFKAAAIDALTVLSDTLRPPGAQSIETNFDGLKRRYSLSIGDRESPAIFTARVNALKAELYGRSETGSRVSHQAGGLLSSIRHRYRGLQMSVA